VSRTVKLMLFIVVILIVGFGVIQLVPYGRDHTNPPVTSEPAWNSPQTKALAKKACFDCHSNETVWPGYSSIAPASWLIYRDVTKGRHKMNFSEWPTVGGGGLMALAAQKVSQGKMPPLRYTLAHSGARLSDAEKQQLIAGFKASAQ
jgi:mono/diheme cytochrome c family protein